MLTSIKISNFKKFGTTEDIPLDQAVVFIGPNNSGKTTALQALALWHLGVNKWLDKRSETKAQKKTGVPLNRKDISAIPTPNARFLWHNLKTKTADNKKALITIEVKGITSGTDWTFGMDFDYFGEEVLYCRPTSTTLLDEQTKTLLRNTRVAFLPPMSGLVPQESKLLPATVNARIGEGRTAEVLRNLCYFIIEPETVTQQLPQGSEKAWETFTSTVKEVFGVTLNKPELNERGEIDLSYRDMADNQLDISASGRGLQQVMLLFAYMFSNPNSILLLDEPDAHLEILRQRMIYNMINDFARENHSQIIAASHSEVVLQEAANKHTVIAFIGQRPHRINNKGSELMKSLTTIGFENYYLAELKKWVLYVEGSTDLAILKTFASKLNHPAAEYLQDPFVHEVATNVPEKMRDHFYGLKEAVQQLRGIALFDRLDKQLQQRENLIEMMWTRREIENYFFSPQVLRRFAHGEVSNDLFGSAESAKREFAMNEALAMIIPPIALKNPNDEYWRETKASEQLDRIFREYHKAIGHYNDMNKRRFFELADYVAPEELDNEVTEKLDTIHKIATNG